MAEHIRHTIRKVVQARLVGLPHVADAAAVPEDSFDSSVDRDAVPCAVVEITTEPITRVSGDEPDTDILRRSPTIEIILVARRKATSAIDQLEAMAAEVESRMKADWNGRSFHLQSTDFTDEQKRGDTKFRVATLTYLTDYQTPEGDPTTHLA